MSALAIIFLVLFGVGLVFFFVGLCVDDDDRTFIFWDIGAILGVCALIVGMAQAVGVLE